MQHLQSEYYPEIEMSNYKVMEQIYIVSIGNHKLTGQSNSEIM